MAILLPPGVTKRSIDTLVSRRVVPFHVSGAVEVVCGHGRVKRSVTELVADVRRERVHECPCCLNLYARPEDTPGLPCPTCTAKDVIHRG